jgi:histidinol-phosphate aminotransferase
MTSHPPRAPIFLDRNENNYGPAPACIDALRRAEPLSLSLYTRAHTRGVKSALSERLAKEMDVPEERILLGYGAEDLLKQTIQCYLKPGAKLMIPSYSWWYYKEIASEVGGTNVEYPLVKGKERFAYDVSGMIDVYRREKPGVVFVSSPNNPTGNSMSSAEMTRVLDALRDVPVVLDQAYWYNAAALSVKEIVERYPNTLLVRTFSKYYALAGVRVGFAAAGTGLAELVKMSHRYLGYSRVSEEIAMAALDSAEYYAPGSDGVSFGCEFSSGRDPLRCARPAERISHLPRSDAEVHERTTSAIAYSHYVGDNRTERARYRSLRRVLPISRDTLA